VIYQQYLRYDLRFSRPNTFIYLPELETIRCRIKIASAQEISPVDVHLRFRGKSRAHGLVHVRPLDDDKFVTEAAMLHPAIGFKLELMLVGVPEDVATRIRAL
jgi:hypothetical protein